MKAEDLTEEERHHRPEPRPKRSRRTEPYYFVVMGKGTFPFDMFRYDLAWAITQTGKLDEEGEPLRIQGERSVIIACWRRELTDDRWASFGWGVIEKLIDRPNFLPPRDQA